MGVIKITEKVSREWLQMKANVKLMKANPIVKVGVLEAAGLKKESEGMNFSGLTVAQVGTFHEFGTTNVPQRSFLRGTVDSHRDEIVDKMADGLERMTVGASNPALELGRIGSWLAGQVKKFISAGIDPMLAVETIRRKMVNGKSGNTPLIDTGQLRQSITHEVVASASGGEGEVTRA